MVQTSNAIHNWFELTYAQYLTLPRSVMEAMPDEWQTKMVELLEELDSTIDWRPEGNTRYQVRLMATKEDSIGREQWSLPLHDKFKDYRHPVQMPFIKPANI